MGGVYIHVPFCKQACYYCDFHFSVNTTQQDELVDQIARELELQKDYLQEPVQTIYLGGGTPSLLTTSQLEKILNTVYKHFSVDSLPEITLEANPDDLSVEKLTALKQSGVNRLSIGIQTFQPELLRLLNRAHSVADAHRCVEAARQAGINNLSIDLMFGLPGQTNSLLEADLATALQVNPPHISLYSLTIEKKTVFGNWARKGKLQQVNEPEAARQFELVMETLDAAGYLQYEISNYCRSGYESKHNSSYWQRKKYLGVGPSAHSFNGNTRQFNIRNNARYLQQLKQGVIPFELEVLTPENKINEYILTTLRTAAGCNLGFLLNEFGFNLLTAHPAAIQQMLAQQQITLDGGLLKLTRAGKLIADTLAAELFALEK
ncbi:MAG: radical SAM family heme chaperone HemW [Cyclobacteriaceae bacterium]|nr:radical SAM family heme chaperone HemW [Cyclobacteriaceae bacterium]